MEQQRVTVKPEILKSESSDSDEIVVLRDDYRFPTRKLPLENSVSSRVPKRSGVQEQVGEINSQSLPRGPNLNRPTEYNTSVPIDLSIVKMENPNQHPADQQPPVQNNGQAIGQVSWDDQGRAIFNGEVVTDRHGLPITLSNIIQTSKFVPIAVVGYTVTTIRPPEGMQAHIHQYGNEGFYMALRGVNQNDGGQAQAENSARNLLYSTNHAGAVPNLQCNNSPLQNNPNFQQNQYWNYGQHNVQGGNTIFLHHAHTVPYYVAQASFVPQVYGNTNGGICTRLNLPEQQMAEGVLDLSGRRTPSPNEEKAHRKQCFIRRRSVKQVKTLRPGHHVPNVRTTSDAPRSSNSSEVYRPESPTNDEIDVVTSARPVRGSYLPEFSMGFPNNEIHNLNLQQNQYNSNLGYGAHANIVPGNDRSANIATPAMPPLHPHAYMQHQFDVRNAGGNPLLAQRHLDNRNNGLSQQLSYRPGPCIHQQYLQQLYAPNSMNPPQDVGPQARATRENDPQASYLYQNQGNPPHPDINGSNH